MANRYICAHDFFAWEFAPGHRQAYPKGKGRDLINHEKAVAGGAAQCPQNQSPETQLNEILETVIYFNEKWGLLLLQRFFYGMRLSPSSPQ
jgi:hypothetical protein